MHQTSPYQTDVLIVGGGPAGLATAIALGQRGTSVTVVEKRSWPVDKVCGEGVMPTGMAILKRLGVEPLISPSDKRPFPGISWKQADGVSVDAEFSCGMGFGVRRTGLSRALYERARALPGITLCEETTVDGIEFSPEAVRISTMVRERAVEWSAQLIIGADGRNSIVKRRLDLQAEPPVSCRRWGVRKHFWTQPWNDRVEVHWGHGLEAYVTPSANHRVEVAFLWEPALFTPKKKGRFLFDSLLDEFPELKAKIGDATEASQAGAVGPLATQSSRPSGTRFLLIGDALGYVDGITGEGISVALEQAEMIGAAMPTILATGDLSDSAMGPLGQALRTAFDKTVLLVRGALLLSRHPWLRNWVVRGLSRSPKMFTHFLDANMGVRPLWKFPLFAIPAFLAGLIHPKRDRLMTTTSNSETRRASATTAS